MLTLKHIDSRLYVVDTEAEVKEGDTIIDFFYPDRYDLYKVRGSAEATICNEWKPERKPKVLGEADLSQAIRVLQEKEAEDDIRMNRYVMDDEDGVHGYLSCLSTHSLTDSEAKAFPEWIGEGFVFKSGFGWMSLTIDDVAFSSAELFLLYQKHCFLSRLDGKECEIKMECQHKGIHNSTCIYFPFLESGKVVVTKIKN